MARATTTLTASSQAALQHLNRIKPTDGWSIQTDCSSNNNDNDHHQDGNGRGGGTTVRLLRRNVPLTTNSFLDIHYDLTTSMVVGVMTRDGKTCQVLVDANGKPVHGVQVTSVHGYPVTAASDADTSESTSAATASTAGINRNNINNSQPSLSINPLDNLNLSPSDRQFLEVYVKYALMGIAALIVIRALAMSTLFYVAVFPLVYLYGITTCPSLDSFDAKKELKRVLRGQYLPDDHPQKPKTMWEQWAARAMASVTTEIATFPGYEVDMMPLAGAAIWTEVKVPTANLQCYWLGANHRFYYIGSRELDPTNPKSTTGNYSSSGSRSSGSNNPAHPRQD